MSARRIFARLGAACGFLLVFVAMAMPAWAQDSQAPAPQSQQEKRIALVVGNSAYPNGALPTTANDAGLVAQTLQAAGFDVVGARDLDQDALRHAFRDFLDKAGQSGPDTIAFVYLAGYGVQLEGQNYFVPVDARLATPAAIPSEAVRIADLVQPLAGLHLKANIVVVDAARANNFAQGDQPLAGGLALMDASPNSLIAFNAAPGTVAPQESGTYGAYAQALAEAMRVGGLPVADVFDRVRLRVNEQTQGGMLPWSASRIGASLVFFDRGQGAPAPQATYYQDQAMQTKRIADFDAHDAYAAAVARDTLPAYQDFITAYPRDPMAKRVRAIIAARREAITWRETWTRDTPNAYWSYLRRYPRGPHAWDARRRLEYLSAALEPPPSFDVIDYDVPPPPPPPVMFLPPPSRDFVELAPPPPPRDPYMLPTPPFVPVPEWARPPRYVEAPPQNFIFHNLHDARAVNEQIQEAPPGAGMTPGQQAGTAAAVAAGAAAVALPFFLRDRANRQRQGQPGAVAPPQPGRAPQPGGALQPGGRPPAQALPGFNGQPLPANNGRPPLPNALPGQQPAPRIQPGRLPPNPSQPNAVLPGQQNQALPGQAGQGPQPGQPGRKGNPRLRQQQGNPPLPGGQGQPNAQPVQPQPNVLPRGKRAPGQFGVPGPNNAAQPQQGGAVQPGGRKLRQQGQPGPGPQPQVQPRPQPQVQPRPQPQVQPRPQPQVQPRPQPQVQPRPQPQGQPRPQPQAQRPPAEQRCGRPGLPPC